jgi:hypothetical protein
VLRCGRADDRDPGARRRGTHQAPDAGSRISLKQAINLAIRAGLTPAEESGRFRTPTFHMGFDPAVPLDKALRLPAELEDEELVRRAAARK